MNFLQIVQMAARESGTVSGVLPLSVSGQTGRLNKFVKWCEVAWTQIQNENGSWRWMRGEFSADLSASTARYSAASFSITRWAEWITEPQSLSIYKKSLGVSDENALSFLEWKDWRIKYDRGVQVNDRPIEVATTPANELAFGPIPDATYTVKGEFRKAPQILAADADVPEMPARFHELIAWEALLLMAEHDEAELHIAVALRRSRRLWDDLRRDQLPTVYIASGPLA